MCSLFCDHTRLLRELCASADDRQFRKSLRLLPLRIIAAIAEGFLNLLIENPALSLPPATRRLLQDDQTRRLIAAIAGSDPQRPKSKRKPKELPIRCKLIARGGLRFFQRCVEPLLDYVEAHGKRLSISSARVAARHARYARTV